jgi:hypothetical protein
MVPIQKKGRSKRGHKDKVLDMALESAPKSTGKKPSNRKKSNSQKPPVTETRDLLESDRSVFINPQAPVFPLNVAPVPILPAIQQQTENNRLNSLLFFDREDDLFACIQSTNTKNKFITRILLVTRTENHGVT